LAEGITADYDAAGYLAGIKILDALKRLAVNRPRAKRAGKKATQDGRFAGAVGRFAH
jgi:hypothetical protein